MKYGRIGFSDKTVTARNIIIATGSVPFVPPGIEVDGEHAGRTGYLRCLDALLAFSGTFSYYSKVCAVC